MLPGDLNRLSFGRGRACWRLSFGQALADEYQGLAAWPVAPQGRGWGHGRDGMPHQSLVKRVTKIADMNGLKGRFEGFASAVMADFGVYSALDKGLIDIVDRGDIKANYEEGLQDVAKFLILPGVHQPTTATSCVANTRTYQALDDQPKAALAVAAIEIARKRPEAIVVALHSGTVETGLSAPYAGRHPTISPQQSTQALLSVIDRLTPADTGSFWDWNSQQVEWCRRGADRTCPSRSARSAGVRSPGGADGRATGIRCAIALAGGAAAARWANCSAAGVWLTCLGARTCAESGLSPRPGGP